MIFETSSPSIFFGNQLHLSTSLKGFERHGCRNDRRIDSTDLKNQSTEPKVEAVQRICLGFFKPLVVSTHLKNMSQIGSISPGRGEHKQNLKPPTSFFVWRGLPSYIGIILKKWLGHLRFATVWCKRKKWPQQIFSYKWWFNGDLPWYKVNNHQQNKPKFRDGLFSGTNT